MHCTDGELRRGGLNSQHLKWEYEGRRKRGDCGAHICLIVCTVLSQKVSNRLRSPTEIDEFTQPSLHLLAEYRMFGSLLISLVVAVVCGGGDIWSCKWQNSRHLRRRFRRLCRLPAILIQYAIQRADKFGSI